MPFRAVGCLRDSIDVGEPIELIRSTLEDHAVDGFGIERDEEKHFARNFVDEALAPLFDPRGMWQRKGELAKLREAHTRRLFVREGPASGEEEGGSLLRDFCGGRKRVRGVGCYARS